MAHPSDPLQIRLERNIEENKPILDRLAGKPGYLVVGVMRDEEHQGDRFDCETLEMAARAVEALLLRGYAWVHIDNLNELEG